MKTIILILFGIFPFALETSGQQQIKTCPAPMAREEMPMQILSDPIKGEIYVLWDMKRPGKATLSIADSEARMTLKIPLKKVPRCIFSQAVSVRAFSPGNYVAVLEIDNKVFSKEFVLSP